MFVTAAWLVVGVSYVAAGAVRSMGAGDLLSGVGQLFVGVAAAVAAIASWLNGRKAKDNSAEAVRSIGPSNGTTLREMVEEIKAFEAYQHDRNHQVINHLAELKASTPLLLKAVERLLAKLTEEEK